MNIIVKCKKGPNYALILPRKIQNQSISSFPIQSATLVTNWFHNIVVNSLLITMANMCNTPLDEKGRTRLASSFLINTLLVVKIEPFQL